MWVYSAYMAGRLSDMLAVACCTLLCFFCYVCCNCVLLVLTLLLLWSLPCLAVAVSLQDPADKRYVLSDEALKSLTGESRFKAFGSNKLFSKHFPKS